MAFVEYILAGKLFLDYTNLLSLNDCKKNDKLISILKINMVEETSLEFRLRKIYATRNYILDQIKHNYLMSSKYKKTFKYLNYIEH